MTGKELRVYRKALKWTQKRLAGELGMTIGYVGDMERGQAVIEKRTELAVRYLFSQHD